MSRTKLDLPSKPVDSRYLSLDACVVEKFRRLNTSLMRNCITLHLMKNDTALRLFRKVISEKDSSPDFLSP